MGTDNVIGANALNTVVAGIKASSNHKNSFVFNSSPANPLTTTKNGQFLVNATGGVVLNGGTTIQGPLKVSGGLSYEGGDGEPITVVGPQGPAGQDGVDGTDGAQGPKGDQGDAGADGTDGEDGISITSAGLDAEGNFILTLSDGSEINVGVVGNPEPKQPWQQLGSDIDGEADNDNSGTSGSLSADGNTVAIGAERNDGNGVDSGHVRVYQYDGTVWQQLGADIDGEAERDYFGASSVSLSADGGIVAIGAGSNRGINGYNSGHVRIYQYDGANWQQLGQDIDGEAERDYFGGYPFSNAHEPHSSVSLSADGGIVAIGAYRNDGNGVDSGHVRIYQYDGNIWQQLGADIDGEAAGDESGQAVSLSADGNTVAIGGLKNDGNGPDSGHVRVYQYDGAIWQQLGADIDGAAEGDRFGTSVSLSADGNILAVGAPYHDSADADGGGHVRVYEYDGSGWLQLGSDIEGDQNFDGVGRSVVLSADGNTAAIQEQWYGSGIGKTLVYRFAEGSWQQLGLYFETESGGSYASVTLSADGNTVAAGDSNNSGKFQSAGHVRVYRLADLGDFGTFSMAFTPISGVGNEPDDTGYGAVDYIYSISTLEVTRAQIEAYNAMVELDIILADMTDYDGNGADKPATGLSWNEVARFVNWLNTSQGYQAAYKFTTEGLNDNIELWSSAEAWQQGGENLYRHKNARYFLPSENEWYKAAYYNPDKEGVGVGGYWDYAVASDSEPNAVANGTAPGTAVYNGQSGPADVTDAGGLSPYGTMAQNGNVWEFTESAGDGSNDSVSELRMVRGGHWIPDATPLQSTFRVNGRDPDIKGFIIGFRVAAILEP